MNLRELRHWFNRVTDRETKRNLKHDYGWVYTRMMYLFEIQQHLKQQDAEELEDFQTGFFTQLLPNQLLKLLKVLPADLDNESYNQFSWNINQLKNTVESPRHTRNPLVVPLFHLWLNWGPRERGGFDHRLGLFIRPGLSGDITTMYRSLIASDWVEYTDEGYVIYPKEYLDKFNQQSNQNRLALFKDVITHIYEWTEILSHQPLIERFEVQTRGRTFGEDELMQHVLNSVQTSS